MTDSGAAIDALRLAEAIREACVQAALDGYEDASLSGLCHEGAWEVAVSAVRAIDLGRLVVSPSASEESTGAPAGNGALRELTARLVRQFASPGPPAAGSAAAVSGAIAAGLLEWAARLSERRGPESFRQRAHAIAGRAAVLQSSLSSAGQRDAEVVKGLFGAQASGEASEARRRATDSLLEIGARCAQAVTLAAEVATHGHAAIRPDVEAALRLAWSATECALALAEENLRPEAEEEWARSANRRAWRTRLLLQRTAPLLQNKESL